MSMESSCSTSRAPRFPTAVRRRRPASSGRRARAGAVSADVGRDAARPRAPHADPARALPTARLRPEDTAFRLDVPRRRTRRRKVARRAQRPEGDDRPGALRAASPRCAAGGTRRGHPARPIRRAAVGLACGQDVGLRLAPLARRRVHRSVIFASKRGVWRVPGASLRPWLSLRNRPERAWPSLVDLPPGRRRRSGTRYGLEISSTSSPVFFARAS